MKKLKLSKKTIKIMKQNGYCGDAYLVTQKKWLDGLQNGLIEDSKGLLLAFDNKLTKYKK